MIRSFQTHRIRQLTELTEKLWSFTPLEGEFAGRSFSVPTPSCWETYPAFGQYRGQGKYETEFTGGGNLRLEFKGVSHTATVYLDGKKIASHYNAYTAFSAIVSRLREGEHTLTVIADNRFTEQSALHVPNDYMSYGGISRPVVLERVGSCFIEYLHVTPHFVNGAWRVQAEIGIYNLEEERPVEICLKIADKTLHYHDMRLTTGANVVRGELSFENVCPWSPDSPNLYFAAATLHCGGETVDDLIERFGFREVTVENGRILLNGMPLKIKGVCRHEDHPQFACALPYSAMAYDLARIKDVGANSVRTTHYPNDERFLDLCDEQGILVWEENHARGLSEEQMRNPQFEKQAERVTEEMIKQHYNHPCIYIWGILNECASDSKYGRECYEKQFALIRRLDKSRPCSFASCKFKTDLCFDLPDIVSYNIYPRWYHNTPAADYLKDLFEWVQTETGGAGKPFLITEVGAGGIYGYRSPFAAKWSEEYQAKTLEEQLSAILSFHGCSGVYVWQFCDNRVSEEWWGNRPRTMNNKGIVDEYRRPKLCYEVVKKIFGNDI